MRRQALIDSKFRTAICAPVYSGGEGLTTQVAIAGEEGLKHASWVMCAGLVSRRKSDPTHCVGSLRTAKQAEVDKALGLALPGMTSGATPSPLHKNGHTLFPGLPGNRDFVANAEAREATLLQLKAHAGVGMGKPYKTKEEFQ